MQSKLKICYNCNLPSRIWRCHEGKKYCHKCWVAMNPRVRHAKPTKIPSCSSKTKKLNEEYKILRAKFLMDNPFCKIHIPGICTSFSTDVHHTYSGKDRQKHFLEVSSWLPLCRTCHCWIDEFPKQARKLGYLK